MFFHNFKYSLKTLLKNKSLIFWTLCFPIILGTLFSLAFSDIEKKEKLDVFQIAIVEKETNEYTKILKSALEELSKGEDKLFDITNTSLEEAEKLLEEKEIKGYINLSEKESIVVGENGIEETVLKTVTERIVEEMTITYDLMAKKIKEESINYKGDKNALIENIKQEVEQLLKQSSVSIKDNSPKNMSYTMIEFYTLIAMTCLYGGLLTMTSINKNLANMSVIGKRVSITPTKKTCTIISSVLASFLIQLTGLFFLFLYTIFILHIDYGSKISSIVLLSVIGSLAGVSLGSFVACKVKSNENTKVGILLAITMTGSFFSGMMGITMKYIIDKNIPIINYINPANMITDGFYALYYYETNGKFYFNVLSLLLFSSILILLSASSLRRQKYDSI